MAEGFLGGILGSKEKPAALEDYVDLDDETDGDVGTGPADMFVKVAELEDLNDVPDLKEEVYSGNIVLIDVSNTDDDLVLERSIKDLRKSVNDIDGDIAALGDDQIILAPTAVKIEREKLVPSS